MATVTNNGSEDLREGSTLHVSGAGSENDAILAVENYLRVNKKEGLEISVSGSSDGGSYEIKLGKVQ